jgi:hypothetical protein
MAASRRKLPFWRRGTLRAKLDITKLRPKHLARGKRFETLDDVREESVRSEELLDAYRPDNAQSIYLRECREGYYHCDRTYCPRCARKFRRRLTGELLRLNSQFKNPVSILTVLLESASRDKLLDLKIERYRHSLRKRLDRAGLGGVPVVGGFEMIYRTRTKEWMLHINLVVFGGNEKAILKFERGFSDGEIDRPVQRAALVHPAKQLSYILKFTTYHRPYGQRGRTKSKALPLNPAEHYALVNWMDQHQFPDYLFLFNARRRGAIIELGNKASTREALNA